MSGTIDFLRPSTNQIRHQIRNILESYNHDWDLIAELAQNSVDAIRLNKPTKGHIKLSINSPQKRIVIEDNGCGIDSELLPSLLAPFSTNKDGNHLLIGQKGVGISFVIFSSSKFDVESWHLKGSSSAKIEGAKAWIESANSELPKLRIGNASERTGTGTRVSISLPKDVDYDFFKLTLEQLELIICSKTAIGDTNTIWSAAPDKDVLLKFVDLNGNEFVSEFDCKYFLPTARLKESQYISLQDFRKWNSGDRNDAQKRAKLRDKLIVLHGKKQFGGRSIRYWSCFVQKRSVWNTISIISKLVREEENSQDMNTGMGENSEFLFSGGMYTSTRGMPTGIRSDVPVKGSAGYLPNFFIIVDDPSLSFDIGRKSIPSRTLGSLRNVAEEVFRDLVNSVKKYIGGEPEIEDDDWDRSKIFNEIRELPDLKSKYTKFLKRPSSQEATVVAMFFELLGQGAIDGFEPYISGYKNRYDLYARYNNSDKVVEFKFALSSLFKDFDNESKLFNEVAYVVVWEIIEHDHKVVSDRGCELERVSEGLTTGEPKFHYKLVLGAVRPIKVICLKEIVDDM